MNYAPRAARPGKQLLLALRVGISGLLLFGSCASGQLLSPLAKRPDWTRLDPYQETITRDDFSRLLATLYAPADASNGVIEICPTSALIKMTFSPPAEYTLRFASDRSAAKPVPRFWHPASSFQPVKSPRRPLDGVRIALDPGHLGGAWAKMEERWFQIGQGLPVAEGDMTLLVARALAARLRELGAQPLMARNAAEPATALRPADLRQIARAELERQGLRFIREAYNGPADPFKENSTQWESELLFYRTSEIRSRAALVNDMLKPDITLCLHFDAEAWGDPSQPRLSDKNHLHLLINGGYSSAELRYDDIRLDMLLHLLGRCGEEEEKASRMIGESLAAATSLPPYQYTSNNARRIDDDPYLWARNLLANRLYACPVVYIEPYVMNSKPVFDRVQLGDYEGLKEVAGVQRKSIYREYADAVALGLAAYYTVARAGGVPHERSPASPRPGTM